MKVLVFLAVIGLAAAQHEKHMGAQVVRVTPKTFDELKTVQSIDKTGVYDFWTPARTIGSHADIMVSPWNIPKFQRMMSDHQLTYEIIMPNVGVEIKKQMESNERAKANGNNRAFDVYHTYDEINALLEELAVNYSSITTLTDVGMSYEGRTMKLMKISNGGAGHRAMFIDGGIHAREWISPAVVTYIMNELLSNNAQYADTMDKVDFYFMPSINPDGYSYSWTDDRMWRKTRSPHEGSSCMGSDPNRNWDFHWDEAGTSILPCADTYPGAVPFSEVECQIVRDQILAVVSDLDVYLTFHSYGQWWLIPYGYIEPAEYPPNYDDMLSLATDAAAALEAVSGTVYTVGNSAALLYAAAGASDDWARGVANISYSYTIELRDTGTFGFILPEALIIPTATEAFAAFKLIMERVRDGLTIK